MDEKISYEELENRNNFLLKRVRDLQDQLSQISNLNNTLYWLFKAVENKEIFDKDFIIKIKNHLQNILTPPENEILENKEQV